MDSQVAITDRVVSPDIESSVLGKEISTNPDSETEVLLVWHKNVDQEYIDAFPKLKLIVRYGIGYDKVDIKYAASKGIRVANNPDYCVNEVADSALSFLLNAVRKTHAYDALARNYAVGWQENVIQSIRPFSDIKVAAIGCGRIGTNFILKAKALGFQVAFYDPYLPLGAEQELGCNRYENLESCLEDSDIVSLHLPLDESTRGLVDDNFLKKMKPGGSLINTSRGEHIANLNDIEAYMKSGRLSQVFLDVLPIEPPDFSSSLLRDWKQEAQWIKGRLMISPHAAYYSTESAHQMRVSAAETAKQFIEKRQYRNLVNQHLIEG